MKKINIYNKYGEVVKHAIVDDTDYKKINSMEWHVRSKVNSYPGTYTDVNGIKKHINMHKIIMNNPPKGMVVDHINGNSYDNRRKNLRYVTIHQNRLNTKCMSKTGYKGVYKSRGNSFYTSIRINDKMKTLKQGKCPKSLYEKYYVPAYVKLHGMKPINRQSSTVRPNDGGEKKA